MVSGPDPFNAAGSSSTGSQDPLAALGGPSHYRTLVEIGSDYAYYASVSEEGLIKLDWVIGDFEKVTGYSIAEVDALGGWPRIIDPEDGPVVQEVIEAFYRDESWTGEIRLVRPDGTRTWTRTAARPILDDGGRLIGVYGAVQDITDQKRAQHDLEEAESRYRDLVEQVPGVVYVAEQGIRGRWHFVGARIKALLGYEPEEWLADPNLWFERVHPDDQDSVLAVDSTLHLAEHEEDRTIEYRMLTRDGRIVWIRDAQTFETKGPSEPILIRGVLFDVTREKAAERALLESEQMYRSLFFHHPDAVFSLDLEGRFRTVNSQGVDLSGYELSELEGETFARLLDDEQTALALERFRRALQGEVQEYELKLTRKDGTRRDLAITNLPIVVQGEVVGVFGIAKDITDKKLLEDQIHQAQKMEALGQLAGGLAHDFNNLLSVILNYSDFLPNDLSDLDRVQEDLTEIRAAAERASSLTKQLLVFSRREPVQLRPVDLNEMIGNIARMLQRTVGEHIELDFELEAELPDVNADPVQIEQILLNLAINARDAMTNGGTMKISTRTSDGGNRRVEMAISDTGIGMTDEVRRRAVDPFFTTKPAGQGTGLGLSTVFGIVQRWNGAMEIASEQGSGTEIRITLPASETSQATEAGKPLPKAPEAGIRRVLVVDDEEALRKVTARILEKNGLEVAVVADAAEALAAIEEDPAGFDVILTDVVMPQMSGIELVKELRKRGHGIKAVYMSGYSTDVIEAQGHPDGPLIEKPFTAQDLLEALGNL